MNNTILDRVLPLHQVCKKYDIFINASPQRVYREILNISFMNSLMFRFLMSIRLIPARITGKLKKNRLQHMESWEKFNGLSGRLMLANEENREVVFGLTGRFWDMINTDPEFARDTDKFINFKEKSYGKVGMNFLIDEPGEGVILSTETRVFFHEEKYLRLFKIYWFFISYFSGLIRKIVLRRIKKAAEAS